ncbi:MAG: hypothetical protein ACI4LX_09070 [Treponema sp.]
MNNTSGIYLNYQTALSRGYSKFLAEGSSVLVRILKQTSPDTYIASFGGKRFPIKSDIPLSAGSKFQAKVFVSGSRLNLVMTGDKIQNQSSAKDGVQSKNPVQTFSTITPEIAEMFASLGLPSDGVSKILMQSVLSLGIKFNLEKINKARSVAQNFPGKEDEAAEAALILLDKGIEPTFENVQDVMLGFSLEKSVQGNTDLKSENFDVSQIEKELKNYFYGFINPKSGLDTVQHEMPCGFLTVFNHIFSRKNFDGSEKSSDSLVHWIVLPFEFQFERAQKQCQGSGVFRVFLDITKKNVKKCVINFNTIGIIWSFVVSYNGERLKSIKFAHFPDAKLDETSYFEKKLSEMFPDVSVKMERSENISGFANDDVPLPLVKGFA